VFKRLHVSAFLHLGHHQAVSCVFQSQAIDEISHTQLELVVFIYVV